MKTAILLLALALASCAPMGLVDTTPGGYRETAGNPETRSFTVIETRDLSEARPGFRPYSTTSIRRLTIREN